MEFFKKMPSGRQTGLGCILVSLIFLTFNILCLTYKEAYFPKFLYISTILFTFGVGLTLVPGIEVKRGDFKVGADELIYIVKNSSSFAKTVWVTAIIVGLVGGLYLEARIGSPRF